MASSSSSPPFRRCRRRSSRSSPKAASSSSRSVYGGNEGVVLFRKREGALVRMRSVTGAHFLPLVGRHGFVR
jgi:hypothetical protein